MLKKRFVFVVFVSLSLWASASYAYDPGAFCRLEKDEQFFDAVGRYYGYFYNNSTSAVYVICPVVRWGYVDRDYISYGLHIWVDDRSTSDNVSCTTITRTANGASQTTTTKSTSGTVDAKELKWFAADTPTAPGAMMYLRCKLPGKTSLGPSVIRVYKSDDF